MIVLIPACVQPQRSKQVTNSFEETRDKETYTTPCELPGECDQGTNAPITPTITPTALVPCSEKLSVSTIESVQGLTGGLIYETRGITYLVGGHPVKIAEIDKNI